jgi:hypothetical protein
MNQAKALTVTILAGWAALLGAATQAQTEPSPSVDARSVEPSPGAPTAIEAPTSQLTRAQRKDAALQARQSGTLRPAGDAADLHDDIGTVPAKAGSGTPSTAALSPAPATPALSPAPLPRQTATPATLPSPTRTASTQTAHRKPLQKKKTHVENNG